MKVEDLTQDDADELNELRWLFDLQHKRSMEAIALWRKHNPGNDLIQPDLSKLLEWLMTRWQEPNA